LPGAKGQVAVDDGHGQRGTREERQHVVGAMAGRAVTVPPAIVPRQEPIERVDCVVVGAGPELQDHEPGRRVRHEHREEPAAAVRMLGDEPPAGAREVGEPALRACANLKLDGLQWSVPI